VESLSSGIGADGECTVLAAGRSTPDADRQPHARGGRHYGGAHMFAA